MSSKEVKEAISHTIGRKQWPSVALIAVGIAAISLTRQGFRDVELAEKIIGALGYAGAALGILSSIRAGTSKQVEEVKDSQKEEHRELQRQMATTLPDDIASKVLDRLAVIDYRDGESEKSMASLLHTVQENKNACDAGQRRTDGLVDVLDNHADHIEALWIHAAALDGTMPPKKVARADGYGGE